MRPFITMALLLAAIPTSALAQEGETPTAFRTLPERTKLNILEQRDVLAPAGSDDSIERGLKFNLDVSEDESSVSMQLGQASTPSGSGTSTNWQVKLTVPIEGLEDFKPGSDLDLMSDGTKLTFSFSFLSFDGSAGAFTSGEFQRYIWEPALEECADRGVRAGANLETAKKDCGLYPPGTGSGMDLRPRIPTSAYATQFMTPVLVDRMNRLLVGDIVRVGVEGAVGFDKMKYVDPATLAVMEPNKTQASGSLFIAWYPGTSKSVLTGRIEYQNGFEAQKEQAVCRPVVVDPATDCVTGSLMPRHVERANISVEYRRVFSVNSNLGSFAIAPKATYDTLSNEFEGVFPVYFIPTDAGPFSPGFEVKYSSKTGEVTTGFFVRSTFKF
jgi:hypothetical protein